jgi:phosphoenolpyruvate phosphomutase
VISYGDLLFRSYILRDLAESDAEFSVVVDSSLTETNQSVRDFALVLGGRRPRPVRPEDVSATRVERRCRRRAARPLDRLAERARRGRARLKAMLATLQARADFDTLDIPSLLNALVAAGEKIEVQYVHGHWRGVNDLEDFRRAGDFAHGQTPLSEPGTANGGAQ